MFELGTDVKPPEIARCVQRLAVAPFSSRAGCCSGLGLGAAPSWAGSPGCWVFGLGADAKLPKILRAAPPALNVFSAPPTLWTACVW